MNENKICFIFCSNDPVYTEECIYYINHLNVPDGYQIDVLTVEHAKSMAAGYNEAMQYSDAKYKIYMHQDTFIVNPDFIRDFLNIFQKDEKIGMIGMIGAPRLPESGVMWKTERCGAIYIQTFDGVLLFRPSGYTFSKEVEAIDGLLMITQYDIPWREDVFDKWDFYDSSQCQEFIRRGYKIIVPEIKEPWCLHDGTLSNMEFYEGERQKFVKEYFCERRNISNEEDKITVVLISHNQKKQLQETLEWLKKTDGALDLIIVDNGSEREAIDEVFAQQFRYLRFDEIIGYGKLWNTVLNNLETGSYVIFMEVGVYPEKECLINLIGALQSEDLDMVSPSTNFFFKGKNRISSREDLLQISFKSQLQTNEPVYRKTLCSDWKIWGAKRTLFEKNGYFCEEIRDPEEVLTDFSLRMIQNGLSQGVSSNAYAYEEFGRCGDIYAEADRWRPDDRRYMKAVWDMNYFNLKPNQLLVECIQESRDKAFSVLELGCDLGATLFAIKNRYPQSEVYGLDINRAAVNVAKHVAKVECGNIDDLEIPFHRKFNYIIFGDVLEHLRYPEEVVSFCHGILEEDGYVIASIPNVMHISVLEELIDGRFIYKDAGLLDRTHIHFFTYYEIMNLFQHAGYAVEEIRRTFLPISDRQKEIENSLLRLSDNTKDWMYETFQYIVRAVRRNE